MANYNIDYKKCNKYSAVIYSSSYINPLDSITDITFEIKRNLIGAGFVLFDFLLSNGDNFNRFAEAYFDGKEIKRDTICVVKLENVNELKQINAHYKGKNKELNNSVLSSSEKYKFSKAK